MDIQIFEPEFVNDVNAQKLYVVRIPLTLAKTGGTGGLFTDTRLALGDSEFVVDAAVNVITPYAGPALTTMAIDLAVRNDGSLYGMLHNDDISIASLTNNNLLAGLTPQVVSNASLASFIKTATLGTLQDSVAGNCTPQAVTSTTTAAAVTGVSSSAQSNLQQTSFGVNPLANKQLGIQLTPAGDTFANLTDGNIVCYFWTRTLPPYAI